MSTSAKEIYFHGLRTGIKFATEWTTLFYSLQHWKNKISVFESEFPPTILQVRLLPNIITLCRQMKIEYEELEYLIDDNEGVNRETEFESIQYKLTVFKRELKSIKKLHKDRTKDAAVDAIKRKRCKRENDSE
jgi:hypothetical protein